MAIVSKQAYYGYCDRSKLDQWICYGTPYGTKQKLNRNIKQQQPLYANIP